ncbi:MAG TPA: GNAT family protein [Steroidobacteraceae bacterium]|nr:GNAT family protein [Steroidobacteraceae bacterium]
MQPARAFSAAFPTARLHLRRYDSSDAQAVLQLMDRNRGRLLRNFPELANGVKTVDEASAYIGAGEKQWEDGAAFSYGIWLPPHPAPIGQVRIKNIVWNVPAAELSYFVDHDYLRRGVATEAIRAVLREAFDARGFRRIYVRVISLNEESLALAHRLNLRHEGVQRNAFRCGFGELHDVHLFALTDADHRSAASDSGAGE